MPDVTLTTLQSLKLKGEKITMLTCYDATFAHACCQAGVEVLLVGDSLGMTIYGMPNTLPVTLEMMIAHGRAVTGAARHALVVVDMPFGSYQQSKERAFAHCARVMAETGCGAVKLEGGEEMADTIRFITERGIPVMAHIGLMPQHVNAMGGFKYQGRSVASAEKIIANAHAVEQAGAFSLVIEGTQEDVARTVTERVSIPTIGIGASPACDGQVLVIDDLLGITEHPPRFAKNYAGLAASIEAAANAFAQEVRSGAFPGMEHCFTPKK